MNNFDFAFEYFSDNFENPNRYHFLTVDQGAALTLGLAMSMGTEQELISCVTYGVSLGGRVIYSVTIGLHTIVLFVF